MLRHTHTTKRYPEEFELESPAVITASNGVELRLYACGQRVGDTITILDAFRVDLRDEERSASVWLDASGNETPQTFSELDAYPEFHGSPLDGAWNEICDGHTETAVAFDDALTALKREFDN